MRTSTSSAVAALIARFLPLGMVVLSSYLSTSLSRGGGGGKLVGHLRGHVVEMRCNLQPWVCAHNLCYIPSHTPHAEKCVFFLPQRKC